MFVASPNSCKIAEGEAVGYGGWCLVGENSDYKTSSVFLLALQMEGIPGNAHLIFEAFYSYFNM